VYIHIEKNNTEDIREVLIETVDGEKMEEKQDTQLDDMVADITRDDNMQQVTEAMTTEPQVVTEAMDSRAQVVTETMVNGAQVVTVQEQALVEVLDAEKSAQLFAALLLEQLSQ